MSGCLGWGKEMRIDCKGAQRSFKGDRNVLKLDYGEGCTTVNLVNSLNCIVKMMNRMVCKFSLNKAIKKNLETNFTNGYAFKNAK